MLSPTYSLRRQKQLVQALEFVRAEERYLPESERTATNHWALPATEKAKATGSVYDTLEAMADGYTGPALPTKQERAKLFRRGPYKGRKITFKGHKWERDAESRRLDREEKIKTMPNRIAEHMKARAATRAASKPSMPF